jgi:hypothetical protein
MTRVAGIVFLDVLACAHDPALGRHGARAAKNVSTALPPWPDPDPLATASVDTPLKELVGRVHGMTLEVVAASSREKINVASGVLARGGLVLTELRAVLVEGSDGDLQPAAEIAVLTTKGSFPARLAGVDAGVGVAVLGLPEAAGVLEGPRLAESSPGGADQLVALRASKKGPALLFEAIGFFMPGSDDPLRPRSAPGLPASFAGAPVFETHGQLAGLLIAGSKNNVLMVPAERLLEILDAVHLTDDAPLVDEHI